MQNRYDLRSGDQFESKHLDDGFVTYDFRDHKNNKNLFVDVPEAPLCAEQAKNAAAAGAAGPSYADTLKGDKTPEEKEKTS